MDGPIYQATAVEDPRTLLRSRIRKVERGLFLAFFVPMLLLLTVYPASNAPTDEMPHQLRWRRGADRFYPGWAYVAIHAAIPLCFLVAAGGYVARRALTPRSLPRR